MNKGRPAPPRRTPTSEIAWPDRWNQKLKTHFGNFALVRSQTGGLAFWCMLGAYLGQLAVKAFNDRVKKSR